MPRRNSSAARVALLLSLAVVLAAAAAAFTAYAVYQRIDTYVVPRRALPFEVPAGATARSVSQALVEDASLHPWLPAYLYLHPELTAIQRGRYGVDGTQTLRQLLQDMVSGNIFVRPLSTVTIVEGLSYELVLDRLAAAHALRAQHPDNPHAYDLLPADPQTLADVPGLLQAALKEPELRGLYPERLSSLEGLLLPATYPYAEGDSDVEVIRQALQGMARHLARVWPQRDPQCPLESPYEALILASIVERESSVDEERALIAGVFCNRLRQRIRLQTDPAVMYGVGPRFRGPLLRSQLRRDTPYNTYTRGGLPPTPIAMPSERSIAAVLHPAATRALYFVAADVDPRSGHVFTDTLAEHNRAVADYRQKVRAYRAAQRRGPAPAAAGSAAAEDGSAAGEGGP